MYSFKTKSHYCALKKSNKSGMILALTLAFLVLVSLMGIAILSNTRTELSVTGNTKLSRDAFNTADNCARITTFLTLALLNPRLENINELLTQMPHPAPKQPLEIEIKPKFNLNSLLSAYHKDYKERYRGTGFGSKTSDPHIIFKMNGKTVAKAVVNIETSKLIQDGMGLGTGDPNDSSNGPKLQIGIIVSVAGIALEGGNFEEPNSVVTIMYREYM
jgi:hypothetical protein